VYYDYVFLDIDGIIGIAEECFLGGSLRKDDGTLLSYDEIAAYCI
jgi:hypothetical protein